MHIETSYLDEATKARLLNRLSRIEGQVRAMKEMVREAPCADDIPMSPGAQPPLAS